MLHTFPIAAHYFPLCLTPEELADPKAVIGHLFTIYRLPMARGLLDKWRKKAFSNHRLDRKTLLSVLELKDQLLRLLEASTLLVDKGESTLDPDTPDIMAAHHYTVDEQEGRKVFAYFPRHLDLDEYINPYLVLEKGRSLYTLPQWREWLLDFWSAGTTQATIYELCGSANPCRCNDCLFKHLEAAHLIYVREFHHGVTD